MNGHDELDVSFNPFLNNDHHVLDDDDDDLLSPDTAHPLKSAALAPVSAGITRPHLSRILRTDSDDELVDDTEHAPSLEQTEEKTVLVHEVSSKDSLAGVALKYNITMAALRRANQLWTSDSIHLRKVLYIPIDQTSPLLNDAAGTAAGANDTMHDASHSKTLNNLTIRRIPARQMSYFPPSKHLPGNQDEPLIPIDPETPSFVPRHTRYASSPPPSLNSILSALPIAASTRDTIIARLSFESSRSTLSDEDHELSDVHPRRASEDGMSWEYSQHTPRVRSHRPSAAAKSSESPPPSPSSRSGTYGSTARTRGHAIYQPETFTPGSLPTHIRSVQLEPTPGMQLPASKSSSRTLAPNNGLLKRRVRLDSTTFEPPSQAPLT